MNPHFWGKMSDEYLQRHPEPLALTSEALAAFENHIGVKLPKSLSELLHIKNGGFVENTDFRFKGEDYEVCYVKAALPDDGYNSIRSYQTILAGPEANIQRQQLQEKVGDLAKLLLLAEPNGHLYAFALNYNRANVSGEPTVLCVTMDCDSIQVNQVAGSFSEFLAGQYWGDERATVELTEAAKYKTLAVGGYEGVYRGEYAENSGTLIGRKVIVRWKICSRKNSFIVFQEINWAGNVKVVREEVSKSALAFDFPSLESYGLEMDSELKKMIRPAIELKILSKYDADLFPDCYELMLHVCLGGKQFVNVSESIFSQGRWKNHQSRLLYSSIKSADKNQLGQVLRLLRAESS